jgi:hypothetical protein
VFTQTLITKFQSKQQDMPIFFRRTKVEAEVAKREECARENNSSQTCAGRSSEKSACSMQPRDHKQSAELCVVVGGKETDPKITRQQ